MYLNFFSFSKTNRRKYTIYVYLQKIKRRFLKMLDGRYHRKMICGGVLILLMFASIAVIYNRSFHHDEFNVNMHRRIFMGGMVSNKLHVRDSVFQKAAVATDNTQCSIIGKDILGKGGSAVDAAIAAMLCLGVINSHSTGIGGGGFMMVYLRKDKKATVIDFRETAPKNAHKDLFKGDSSNGIRGGLAVAIPGELRGMELAYRKFGKLPWKELFKPAIKLAKHGFKMTQSLCIAINKWKKDVYKDPCMKEQYVSKKTGKLYKKGDIVTNKPLAKTLQKIAEVGGAGIFYMGKMAAQIVDEVHKKGGIITKDDLRGYTAVLRTPLESKIGDYLMLNTPPPASGPVLAFILNILKGYNMTEKDMTKTPSIVYHRMIEAFKFAYAQRSELADPDLEKQTIKVVENMLDEELAESIRHKINDGKTHNVSYYEGKSYEPVTTGTTHLVVVAPNGDAVSVMSTVNGYLGAKFRSCKLGFVYNNEMDDFSTPGIPNEFGLEPSEVNFIKPDKRPQSSSVPVIVLDKHMNVKIVAGGSGGSIITTAVAEVIMNHLWFGMSMKDAVQQPRVHSQLVPNSVFVESRMPANIVRDLTKRGHNVSITDESHAVVQGVARVEDEWQSICKKGKIENSTYCIKLKRNKDKVALFAESDFRKGGTPAGF